MRKDQAKVISFVPSWTETFVECGVSVVGRTRFCIHPDKKVSDIPIVGGTKTHQTEKILKLGPDYVVLDKEENKRELADELTANGVKILVSHVTSIASAVTFLREASEVLQNKDLSQTADRYDAVLKRRERLSLDLFWNEILQDSDKEVSAKKISDRKLPLLYLIWKNPYMSVAEGTFIWEQFQLLGLRLAMPPGHKIRPDFAADKYPQISEDKLSEYFCLLSSEPFPFANSVEEFSKKNISHSLVDGEKISWYGIRNLKFLESCLK